MLAISQSHLTLLSACERKYQYVFLDALSGPSTYEQQTTTQWGSQFHLLMQQRALDLPVEVLAKADVEMSDSLAALAANAPEVFAHLPVSGMRAASGEAEYSQDKSTSRGLFSQSEHRRQLAFNGYLLTVVYDLVVVDAAAKENPQGQIFDWKTHQRPPRRDWLKDDWQTRLYLYVLCETTDLRPEQISMTYWFVRLGAGPQPLEAEPSKQASAQHQPSFYRFDYTAAQHLETEADLKHLSDRLTHLLKQAEQGLDLPKVAIEKGLCDRCLFNVRCDRVSTSGAIALSPDPYQLLRTASQLTADSVEEIPLL